MKQLLKENYMSGCNKKRIRRAVLDLFDEIKYYEMLLEESFVTNEGKTLPIKTTNVSDPISGTLNSLEKMANIVNAFYKKVDSVKETFTEDELVVFECSVEKREKDEIIMCTKFKNAQKYYQIKNSMYFKLAIKFKIVNPYEYIDMKQTSNAIIN